MNEKNYLLGIHKDDLKEEFADITDFAKELGTTTENLLMYLLAKQLEQLVGGEGVKISSYESNYIMDNINESIQKLTETINDKMSN